MTSPPRPSCRRRPSLWLLTLAIAAGCGEGAVPGLEPTVRDSAGVVIHEFTGEVMAQSGPLLLADEPSPRIGVMEGPPEYQWTRPVAGTRLADGGFAVLEQVPPEIRLYDGSGRFMGRVGAEGDGPGEFRSPTGLVALPGDTLLVWDRRSRRLSWFGPDGTLARERTLREPGGIRSVRHVALTPGGTAVVLGATTTEEDLANQGRVREGWQLVPLAPGGGAEPALGTVPGTERAIDLSRAADGAVVSVNVQGRWWWGEGFAWAAEGGVWTAERLALEARHFDLERGLDRIVRVRAQERPFTQALIDSLHGVELERVGDSQLRELWRADFLERDYPPGVPPVAAVFADAGKRVWIGLTEPPPERLSSGELMAVRRWLVFQEEDDGPAGEAGALRFAGTVILPPQSHPLWADDQGVLLVRNDPPFDVPYVEWYPFVGR